MAGRQEFSKIQARALTDPRVLRAADLYVERRIAREETAHATVIGHIGMLGLLAMRATDDGRIPGDGVGFVRAATMTSPKLAAIIASILKQDDVDLLTRDERGLRLRGFVEAYQPVIERREADAARARTSRERKASRHADAPRDAVRDVTSDVAVTSDRRGEESRVEPPKPPVTGGPERPGQRPRLEPLVPNPRHAEGVAMARAALTGHAAVEPRAMTDEERAAHAKRVKAQGAELAQAGSASPLPPSVETSRSEEAT